MKEAPDAAFWSALGGEGPIAPASEAPAPEKEDVGEGVLYKLSDASGALTCTEAKRGDIKMSDLDSNDVFILDAGREIFVWVGSSASDAERRATPRRRPRRTSTRTTPIHTAVPRQRSTPSTPGMADEVGGAFLPVDGHPVNHIEGAAAARTHPRSDSERGSTEPGLEVILRHTGWQHAGKKTALRARLNAPHGGLRKTAQSCPLAATGPLLHLRQSGALHGA